MQSSFSSRARPPEPFAPELLGVDFSADAAASSTQMADRGCLAPVRSSLSSAGFSERGELGDILPSGMRSPGTSPIGCSSLSSDMGTLISSPSLSHAEDMLSSNYTDTMARRSSSMRTIEDSSSPKWESFCANMGILAAFAFCDMLHQVELEEQPSGLGLLLPILYAALALLLIAVGVLCCWCSNRHYRSVWLLIVALHAAVGLISGLWRDFGSGAACTAGVLQVISVVLYPVDLLNVVMVDLAMVLAFVALGITRALPILALVEGIVLIVAVGIGTCITWIAATPPLNAASANQSQPAPLPLIILRRVTQRRAWRDSSIARSRQSDIQTLFAPIFMGDSCAMTPVSNSEYPEVTTRLDRLVSRILTTKDNIERSSLDGELRKVLGTVFGFVLKELKGVSSLHFFPVEELTTASPMTVEYVRKTLNQEVDYRSEGPLTPTRADDNTTEVVSDQNKTPRSCQKIVEEQTKPCRRSSRISSRDTLDRLSTKDSEDQAVATAADVCRRDFTNMLWQGTPETPATFDQAIGSMMTCLTFCEYWDQLPPPCMDSDLQTLLSKELGTWSFDVFKFSRLCENRPLIVLGERALQPFVAELGLKASQVNCFLDSIEARYHSTNMYHNSMHAADVMNSALYFLSLRSLHLEGLEALEQLSCLVAASAHDVGHNSKANRFHIAAATPLAMLFNDQSVLENMHCALTFAVLHGEASNFIAILEAPMRSAFRSLVLHQILDTDLAKHIQTVSRFRQEFLNKAVGEECGPGAKQNGSKPSLTVSQRKELLSFVLKSADVSGSTKPFDLHVQWTMRINTEFFEQGDVERELGLPCSPFCDRHGTNLAESQRGFFDFIVTPLYTAIDEYLQSRRLGLEVMPEMDRNRAFWKRYDAFTFDYSNPMSNGDILRRAFISGLTQNYDDQDDALLHAHSVSNIPGPTLLSYTCAKGSKMRLSSKEGERQKSSTPSLRPSVMSG